MENLNKSCFICGEIHYDGIILNGEIICKACEEKIVNTVIINPDYEIYKDQLKKILFKKYAQE